MLRDVHRKYYFNNDKIIPSMSKHLLFPGDKSIYAYSIFILKLIWYSFIAAGVKRREERTSSSSSGDQFKHICTHLKLNN
jgi:hypothetical protein